MPETQPLQRVPMQPTESATNSAGVSTDHHLMPGLVDELVYPFYQRRKHLTTRGVARIKRVGETHVITALFRQMDQRVNRLEAAVTLLSVPTVRENIHILRRTA